MSNNLTRNSKQDSCQRYGQKRKYQEEQIATTEHYTVSSDEELVETTATAASKHTNSSNSEGDYQLLQHEVLYSSTSAAYEVLEFLGRGNFWASCEVLETRN